MTEQDPQHHPDPQPQEDDSSASNTDQPRVRAEGEEQTDSAERVEQDLERLLADVRTERDQLEQQLRRTAADYQNYARRADQNTHTAREQQLMEVGKALVSVLDHFDRALEVDPQQARASDVLDGVRMVHGELLRALANVGIERVDAHAGQPFDPNHHEALMRQPSEKHQPNEVLQQLQPGYRLHDKTIRPAQVSVAE